MSKYEEINNSDLDYLKKHFNLHKVDFFKDVILKEKIGNAYFFLFPFFDSDNNIVGKTYFNINYKKKEVGKTSSKWSKVFAKNELYDYLFLSDNPLSLIKYYSRLSTKYKNKNLLFLVPYKYDYGTIVAIKKEYDFKRIITLFDNKATSDLFRIITNSGIAEKKIKIEIIDGEYNIKYKNHTLTLDKLDYHKVFEKYRLYSGIDHKKNKEYEKN